MSEDKNGKHIADYTEIFDIPDDQDVFDKGLEADRARAVKNKSVINTPTK